MREVDRTALCGSQDTTLGGARAVLDEMSGSLDPKFLLSEWPQSLYNPQFRSAKGGKSAQLPGEREEKSAVLSIIGPLNHSNAKTSLPGAAYQGGAARRFRKFLSTEVMAMSRKEAINQLREQLIRRRDALHRALEGDLSLLRELHQERTGDVMDAAADAVQDELNSQLIEAESRELGAINSAIARIEQGIYGECESCGKSIPLTRLRAIPYATDCIGCRRKAESRASGGDAVMWNRVFDNAEVDSV